jgi:hypothetical protein
MRIIDKYKDYYDCIKANDFEQVPVYIRKQYTKQVKNFIPYIPYGACIIIGFCGKMYPMIQGNEGYMDPQETFSYSLKEVEKFYWWERLSKWDKEVYNRFFVHDYTSFYGKQFEKERCPIFVVKQHRNYDEIHYNAHLNKYDFARIVPPYQAYQAVRMWLDNQAMPEKPIPEMDDQTKAEAHGYNKFSFRKDPTKKKR